MSAHRAPLHAEFGHRLADDPLALADSRLRFRFATLIRLGRGPPFVPRGMSLASVPKRPRYPRRFRASAGWSTELPHLLAPSAASLLSSLVGGLVVRIRNASSLLASSCRDDIALARHKPRRACLTTSRRRRQHARCCEHDLAELDVRFLGFVSYGSFCAGRMFSCVVIMLRLALALGAVCSLDQVVPGRVCVLRAASDALIFSVANVHWFVADNALVQQQIRLRRHFSIGADVFAIIGGDNFRRPG